ncbi:uncharacterized protein PHACADRAFT_187528 [Phanerochaete carnosa HHB-10118-sp]|uniref:Uncharacterized protein n=1 Tax=Phanerochaete carnosa (strain HHB-10118-sp) TaxID=650164 RepID=K5VVP8_PHACS|nr:uncharacterized protein PHACADRAFT_187528 [Phanerochaete carnosa HHB-10118-sp]EKM50860.1 hypothetical protein PHACADRAFT_187528 [Phanerochaete carnosa HHB-10118-sp]
MLLSMDAIMADDNLLPTMWDVLKQRSDPANLLDFVVNLIASRAGSKAEYLRSSRPRRIPDLTLLSRRAWITFMEMLADLAGRRQLSPPPVSNPDWPYKTILLLLSTSHYPLPSSAKACLLSRLMAASGSLEGADAFARWIGPRSHEQEVAIDLRPLFDRLCLASDQGIQDDENALLPIAAILANDNILPTMLDLLKQQTHNPVQSLSCIAHLIVGRLGTDASHILLVRLRSIPDLTLLSQLAWDIVMEMLVDLADRRQPSGPLDDSSPDWLHKTTLLLLSTSPYPLLDFALACVRGLLPDAPVLAAAMPVAQWITSRPNEQEFNLHSLFRPIPGADERASQGDKDILLSIAAIMTDDNLLPTVRNMLKQSTYDPMQSLSFIIHLIVSRLGAGAEYLLPVRLRAIPDLTSISRRTWDTLMEMLVDLADRRDPSGSLLISSPDWLHKLTLLFLSTSPYPLPNSAVVCLRRLLAHNKEEWEGAVLSIARWISPRPDEKSFVFRPLSDRLQPVYEHGGQDDECLLTVLFMYSEFLRPYRSTSPSPGVQPPSLYTMLSQEPDLFEHQMARPILDDIWNLIHSVLLFDSKYDSPRTLNGRNECIHILWELSDRMVRRDNGIASLAAYWGNEQWDLLALTHTFSSLHHFTHAPRTYMLQLCMDAFAGTHDQAKIAENSATVACQFEDGTFDDTGRYIPIDMVRFCYLHIRLYAEHIQGGPPTVIASSLSDRSATLPEPVTWTSLWDATSAALHKYSAEEGCPDASAREPTFPDELIAALGFFILPEDVSKYPRLARLQERERPGLPQPASRTASPSGSADMLSLRDVTEPPPSSQPAIQLTQNGPSQEEPSSTQSNGRSHHIARDAEESRVDAGSTRGHAGAEEGPMNDEPGAARDGAAVRGKVGFDEAGDEATEDDESEGGVASEGDATERGPDEDNAQVDERQAAIADHLGPPGGGGEVGGEVGGYGSSGSGHEPPGRDGIEGRDGVGTKFVE